MSALWPSRLRRRSISKPNFSADSDASPIDIFLQPGEFFVGDRNYQIRTLLGSCVSIVLWHPQKRIGAMSHFLLASRPVAGFAERDPRYGREALSLMIDGLRNSGVSVAQCEAKIFGGGNMFPHRISGNSLAIGKQNGKAATALVQELGIPVVSKCLYGTAHRQIVFRIATGDVWVRRPSPVNLQEAEAIK